jgi:hypothetical protein
MGVSMGASSGEGEARGTLKFWKRKNRGVEEGRGKRMEGGKKEIIKRKLCREGERGERKN